MVKYGLERRIYIILVFSSSFFFIYKRQSRVEYEITHVTFVFGILITLVIKPENDFKIVKLAWIIDTIFFPVK